MPTSAEAYVVQEAGAPFKLQKVELDDPLENEVLVKMVASGVCHTDLTVGAGLLPSSFPAILGHEGAGIVKKVGSDVKSLKEGDHVLLSWTHCTQCKNCKSQDPVACQTWYPLNFGKTRANGSAQVGTAEDGTRVEGSFFGQSSFGTYGIVKETSCVKVDKDVDLEICCSIGCGIQTGSGGVLNVAQPKPDDTVLISGLGSVGFSALFAALSLGVKNIIAVDLVDSRLEQAKSFGASHVINARNGDPVAEVMKITQDAGVRYAIECTGAPKACRAAFLSTGVRGTMVQIGASTSPMEIASMEFLSHIRSIVGCVEGDGKPQEFIPRLVEMYKSGKLPLDKITTKYDYKDLETALHDMHEGKCVKAVLTFPQ